MADCIISILDRQAIILGGYEYDNETYYKIDEFPAEIQNVSFEVENGFFTLEANVTWVGNTAIINISDVKFYDNNNNRIDLSKYEILYKSSTSDEWARSDNHEIEVDSEGEYYIKIVTKNGSYNISGYKTSLDDTTEDEYKIVKVTKPDNSNKVDDIAGIELDETRQVEDRNGDKAWVPGGYIISDIEDEQEIRSGLVIKDRYDNEWVWVPISNSELTNNMISTGTVTLCDEVTTTDKYSKLWGFDENGRTEYKSLGTPGQSSKWREPDVVIGSGRKYDASNYSTILSNNTKNLTVDITTPSLNLLAQQFVNDYHKMIDSIKKYEGFYIARYELSGEATNPAVVKYGQSGNITWYDAYVACSQFTSRCATGTMIWGTQWDATLEWLAQSYIQYHSIDPTIGKSYAEIDNAKGWGNYGSSDFTYRETADGELLTKSVTKLIPTGGTDYTKANNIYDLAGNCREWTQEASSTHYRVLRRRTLSSEWIC